MAGIALAAKLRKERRVAVTYVGDGATSTGPCHEGMNFAAVLKLPLLIIAENNGWAYSTPIRKQMAIQDIAERGEAYGIPASIVDGNDVMKGHAEHDDARYVPEEEFEKWRKKDPILCYQKYLVQHKLMTDEEKGGIEARIEKEIREDVAFAESSPFPQPEEAARPVWV
jgi:TPP-dependent pyruvate/acetoin dehydrogenase alpha subunit